MAKRTYISDTEASYFINNRMLCLENIPTEGNFIVGDIVISNKQKDSIFGWVCIEAGSPGKWEVIIDLSIIKNAIKSLEEQDKTHTSALEIIRQRAEVIYNELNNKDKEHESTLDNHNKRIVDNAENITIIINDLTKLGKDVVDLERDLRELIEEIIERMGVNTTNISKNMSNITTNTNDIKDLKDKVSVNTTGITKNNENINKLTEQVETNVEDINKLIEQVETNVEDINKNVEGIKSNDNDIKINTEKINELEERINAHDDDVENITNLVAVNTKNITTNINDIKDLKDKLDDTDDSINDLLNRVDSLEGIDLSVYQTIIDDDLATEAKTITGAINELFVLLTEIREIVDNLGENSGSEPEEESGDSTDKPCTGISVTSSGDVYLQSPNYGIVSITFVTTPVDTTDSITFDIGDTSIVTGTYDAENYPREIELNALKVGSTTLTIYCGDVSTTTTITVKETV